MYFKFNVYRYMIKGSVHSYFLVLKHFKNSYLLTLYILFYFILFIYFYVLF